MNKHRGSDFNEFMIEQGLTNTDHPMTPTPRTEDEAEYWLDPTMSGEHQIVSADFARQLERELAAITCEEGELWELRQANTRMKDNLASLSKLHAVEADGWKSSHKRERALADRLAGLLENCREDSCELLGERGWWKDEPRCDYSKRYDETAENITMADAALAAWKEARRGS